MSPELAEQLWSKRRSEESRRFRRGWPASDDWTTGVGSCQLQPSPSGRGRPVPRSQVLLPMVSRFDGSSAIGGAGRRNEVRPRRHVHDPSPDDARSVERRLDGGCVVRNAIAPGAPAPSTSNPRPRRRGFSGRVHARRRRELHHQHQRQGACGAHRRPRRVKPRRRRHREVRGGRGTARTRSCRGPPLRPRGGGAAALPSERPLPNQPAGSRSTAA